MKATVSNITRRNHCSRTFTRFLKKPCHLRLVDGSVYPAMVLTKVKHVSRDRSELTFQANGVKRVFWNRQIQDLEYLPLTYSAALYAREKWKIREGE